MQDPTAEARDWSLPLLTRASTYHVEASWVVLDLEMPVMTGWEFLAIPRVYHCLSEIPVIVTSGSQKQSEALKHGAVVDYLSKPVDFARLAKRVREVAPLHCARAAEKQAN